MLKIVTMNDEQMISGLLKKRKQVMGYILETRNDLAKLGEDLRAIDRALEAFQYNGNIPLTQRSERVVLFFKGELTNWIMLQLSQATEPISSRQIAESFVQLKGSPDDHRLERDILKESRSYLSFFELIKSCSFAVSPRHLYNK